MIVERDVNTEIEQVLVAAGHEPLIARLLASRGVMSVEEAQLKLELLPHFNHLKNMAEVSKVLADAIIKGEKIVVAGDYDADGATACAVSIKSIRAMGGVVDFIVPVRDKDGYGLSTHLVDKAKSKGACIIMTVDNGIAALASVAYAKAQGMTVIVTDHHLPGDEVPDCLIVNPNQKGCLFPSKNLAGVGVAFYVMLALRHELESCGYFQQREKPNLAQFLDLVALGTVADVVPLDHINRILVNYGLRLIQSGQNCVGIQALIDIAGKCNKEMQSYHLGFVLGPRINAAGRLDDITTSIICLLSDDYEEAYTYAKKLNEFNQQRKKTEAEMLKITEENLAIELEENQKSIVRYSDEFHQGVIGIVASRLKEKYYLPTIVFAKGEGYELKGSGRSIPGCHLRDILDVVAKRHPGLIIKFGGHAMAAGLSIDISQLETFKQAFERTLQQLLPDHLLKKVFLTDGALTTAELNLHTAKQLDHMIWGQGFEKPAFYNRFEVVKQQLVGIQQKHLKVVLKKDNGYFGAMLFGCQDELPPVVDVVYRMVVNEYRQTEELQLYVDHWQST